MWDLPWVEALEEYLETDLQFRNETDNSCESPSLNGDVPWDIMRRE